MSERTVAYQVLAADLRGRLRAGEFADGRPLPTETELARVHAVSRQTVRRAMQELVADGAIYRVAGRGTFASTGEPYVRHLGSVEELMGLALDTELRVTAPLAAARDDAVPARRLEVAEGSTRSLSFVRRHGDVDLCLTTVHLPGPVAALLDGVAALTTRGARTTDTVIGLLDARLERPITRAEQTITATTPPLDVQVHLGVDAAQPVLRVERRYEDADGRPVELAVTHFPPDRYAYRVTLQRRP